MSPRARLAALAALAGGILSAAEPVLSDISVRAVSPWTNLVEIAYRTSGDFVPTQPNGRLLQTVTIRDASGRPALVLTNNLAETSLFPRTPSFAPGEHRLVWTPSDPSAVPEQATVEIAVYETTTPQSYCVVDLSGGAQAEVHPVSYLDAVPTGGWTDAFKTDHLVLRLVRPGTFTMGDLVHGGASYPGISLTQPYYIGVFETTQRQWELMGGSPNSAYDEPDQAVHPAENMTFTDIRGNWGYLWPDSYEDGRAPEEVEDNSLLGGLRARTGLRLDLPTEAQWEHACRAGTATDYGNGTDYSGTGYQDAAMDAMGRYVANCPAGGSTAPVGTYAPNAWGLYDMHGNVQELCLDRYNARTVASPAVDPRGPSDEDGVGEDEHAVRGGHWESRAAACTSGYRGSMVFPASQNCQAGNDHTGFRLACPAPAAFEARLCLATSAVSRLELSSQPVLTVGAESVPIDFDPLYAGVDPSRGDCVVRVTLDGAETLVETNGFGRLEGWTAHWHTNVLRQVVLRDGVEVGTPLERTLVSTLGPDSLTLAECVNAPELTLTAGGTGGWSRDTATNMDGVVSLRSRDTGLDGETWLETTVVGGGTLSFWWKVEGEHLLDKRGNVIALYDYVSLEVDGREEKSLGVGEWTLVTLEISGEGEHVLRWTYRKDDDDAEGDSRADCAWLDRVSWSGAVPGPVRDETETTEVPVKYAWLDRYPSVLAAAGGDYEAAANAPTGKRDAAGRPMYVWQDFVAGTDPTDPDDRLRARIELVDGLPVVTWTPDLNADGSASRVYKVLGRTSLDDAAGWTVPADPSVHRFFKVCVEMP